MPRLRQVWIRIGKPLTFEAYQGTAPGKARRAITDEVIQAIQDLSGQEYVPMYASVRKAEMTGGTSAGVGAVLGRGYAPQDPAGRRPPGGDTSSARLPCQPVSR